MGKKTYRLYKEINENVPDDWREVEFDKIELTDDQWKAIEWYKYKDSYSCNTTVGFFLIGVLLGSIFGALILWSVLA